MSTTATTGKTSTGKIILIVAILLVLIVGGIILYRNYKKSKQPAPAPKQPAVVTEPGTGKGVVSNIHNGLDADVAPALAPAGPVRVS